MSNLNKYIRIGAALCAAVLAASALSACGVSEKDYKRLERRVTILEQSIDGGSGDLDAEEGETKRDTEKDNGRDDNSSDREITDDRSDNTGGAFDEGEVSRSVDIEEHDYVSDNGDKYAFFIIDNASEFDVNARIKIVSKNSEGKEIETEVKNARGIPAGSKSFASFKLERDTDTIVRTVNYTEYTGQSSPLESVTAKATKAQGGANITIRNTGGTETDDLKYLTLFFKDSSLAGFDSDELPEIAQSGTETIPSVFANDFDTAEVYLRIDE